MQSKDWSGFGYLSPDFAPRMPVSQRIWTLPTLAVFDYRGKDHFQPPVACFESKTYFSTYWNLK